MRSIMTFTRFDANQSKIMLLQLRKRREHFISIINGELLQKRSPSSFQNEKLLKKQIISVMKKGNWEYVPKAKLAVNIRFKANYTNIPELPKLVKYFLDILSGTTFRDDMQIEYLTACCYRPSDIGSNLSKQKDSIFVEVERLSDFKQKFVLYRNLMDDDEFRDYAESHLLSARYLRNENSNFDEMWPDEETAKFFNLNSEVVESWHKMIRKDNQKKILSRSNINVYDWPDVFKDPLYEIQQRFWNLNPFIFEVQGLPTSGGKKKYKERLRIELQKLNKRFASFGRIIAPLELDVHVRPKGSKLNRDLDNIMLIISNVFTEELLEEGSYIHGYRIYLTRLQNKTDVNGSLRFKLLPLFAIDDFNNLMKDTLKLGTEWLAETSSF